MRWTLLILVLLVTAAPAHARPGDLDRSFASGGRIAFKVWGEGGAAAGFALVDGLRPLMSVSGCIAAVRTPASLQPAGPGRLQARTAIENSPELQRAAAVGRVRVPAARGDPETLNSVSYRYRVSRLGSAQPPVELTLPARGPTSTRDFGVGRDGRLIVVSGHVSEKLRNRTFVSRFSPSGVLDTGFGSGGRRFLARAASKVIVKPDGRMFCRRQGSLGRSTPMAGRQRLRQGGMVLPGKPTNPFVNAIAEGPAGTFLVAGATFRGWVARLHPTGRLDRSFGTKGFVTGRKFKELEIDAIARDRRGLVPDGS